MLLVENPFRGLQSFTRLFVQLLVIPPFVHVHHDTDIDQNQHRCACSIII
jgi:hypothetical protein